MKLFKLIGQKFDKAKFIYLYEIKQARLYLLVRVFVIVCLKVNRVWYWLFPTKTLLAHQEIHSLFCKDSNRHKWRFMAQVLSRNAMDDAVKLERCLDALGYDGAKRETIIRMLGALTDNNISVDDKLSITEEYAKQHRQAFERIYPK